MPYDDFSSARSRTGPHDTVGPMTDGDAELLACWRRGDPVAGERLIARHFPRLLRFFRASAPDAAEDLAQETLLECCRHQDRLDAVASFPAFLLGIARNRLLMYWRARSRRGPQVEFSEASIADLEPTPTELRARSEQERLLLRALRNIPLDSQILLQMYYWEHLGGPDLAAVFAVPEGTIRGRLRRARELLTRALEALADSPEAVRTTLDGLDRWAQAIRQHREPHPRR